MSFERCVCVSVLFTSLWSLCRDLMDRLVDEAEGLVAEGSASVCSSSSGRMEPPTDQQINLLNSITASDLSGAPQHPHAQNKKIMSISWNLVCSPGNETAAKIYA